MTRSGVAAFVFIALMTAPACARPPTTTVSPGYDRRLQESRKPAQDAATQPYLQPSSPYAGDRRYRHRRHKHRR